MEKICPDCEGDTAIRNPTGNCDHLYYPDYKNKINNSQKKIKITGPIYNNSTVNIFHRWQSTLRNKASQYEHEDRKNGKDVVYPSLDDICNEMNAFLAGIDSK